MAETAVETMAGSTAVQLRLLGPVTLIGVDGAEHDLGPGQQRCVLAVLLWAGESGVTTDTLLDRVWDDPPTTARPALYSYLSRLRPILRAASGKGPLVEIRKRRTGGYQLDIPGAVVDWHRSGSAAAAARTETDPRRRADLLADALEQWRAQPLDGLTGQWVEQTRVVLDGQYVQILAEWADAHRRIAGQDVVIPMLSTAVTRRPYAEPLAAQLLWALHETGRHAEGLHWYARLREQMLDELGSEPGPPLREAHAALLTGSAASPARTTSPSPPATAGAPVAWPRPAQLPPAVTGYVGRTHIMRRLNAVMRGPPERRPAPPVVQLSGTGGAGKTALAVQWAHQAAADFPDGQLYVNLRGFSTDPPLAPVEALAGMLRALGIAPGSVPTQVEEAASLYRSTLDGRAVLVVLDNAKDAEQVRPLLPASPEAAVLVTSRDRLTGLLTSPGSEHLTVPPLSAQESAELFARMLGHQRTADGAAVARLVQACAGLPLAVVIAAAGIRADEHLDLAAYAAHLDRGDPMAMLDEVETAIRGSFDLSYRALPEGPQLLFRRAGALPLPEVTVTSAAVAADVTEPVAAGWLRQLARAHLLEATGPGRYQFHDLLRWYARDRASNDDPAADHQQALERVCGWYRATVRAAVRTAYPERLRLPEPDRRTPLVLSVPPVEFADGDRAVEWVDAERLSLTALATHTATHGPAETAWMLSDDLKPYFLSRKHLLEWRTIAGCAVEAAEQAGDRQAQAAAYGCVGVVAAVAGDYVAAIRALRRAMDRARGCGWREGETLAMNNLGLAYFETGNARHAARLHRRVLTLVANLHDPHLLTLARIGLGQAMLDLGQLDQAFQLHQRNLTDTSPERFGRADSTFQCALVAHGRGQLEEAYALLEQALALYGADADRAQSADVISRMAWVRADQGRLDEALALCRDAETTHPGHGQAVDVELSTTLIHAHCLRYAGQDTQARELYQHVAARAQALRTRRALIGARLGLGVLNADPTQLETALEMAAASGYRTTQSHILTALARLHLPAGDLPLGIDLAGRAVALAEDTGFRLGHTRALDVLGQLHEAAGHIETAHRTYAAVRGLAEQLSPGISHHLHATTSASRSR